ncbi:hypothetical protein OUZ56_018685 [Daphnia magna]|uniref:Uncharacterized protein n=1 Tax=Daphnia magna TaxID=35525 RepID=A0ABQ9Z9K0_9CRUS|nr:hypothetical protein OUZ56_018685 [Daphnia magna]
MSFDFLVLVPNFGVLEVFLQGSCSSNLVESVGQNFYLFRSAVSETSFIWFSVVLSFWISLVLQLVLGCPGGFNALF